ncbi:MAG: flagellar biosynthetic protein FliO [Lachnospiraceae bacterium]|nr:flagellar biosynthetic protein FliO [Lachnospiraceae bacterium]
MPLTVTGSSSAGGVGQLIVVLLVFVGVLALCYYVTKWIAGFQKQQTAGNNLQIIESCRIANNSYLQLIKVGKTKYAVIAVGKNEISTVMQLTEEDLRDDIVKNEPKPLSSNFKDLLDKVKEKNDKS